MPVKYKPSNFVKSRIAKTRGKTKHFYMHQLDNTQLWKEFFSTSNKKIKRKMRNELYMRGYRLEDFTQRQAER
jgi:hypothetical protein